MTTILELRNRAASQAADIQIEINTRIIDNNHREDEFRHAVYERFVQHLCDEWGLEPAEIRPALRVTEIDWYHGYSDRLDQALVTFDLVFPPFEFDDPRPGDRLPWISINAWFKGAVIFPAELMGIYQSNDGCWYVSDALKNNRWHRTLASALLAAEEKYLDDQRYREEETADF